MPKKTHHVTGKTKKRRLRTHWFFLSCALILFIALCAGGIYFLFEQKYSGRVYPGVTIAHQTFAGATSSEITQAWLSRNRPFQNISVTLRAENTVATLSATQLDIGYDATLSATQALSIGRSGNLLTDFYHKYVSLSRGIDLAPLFRWNEDAFNSTLEQLAQRLNIEPENALFEFKSGRVVAFKPAAPGRALDVAAAKQNFTQQIELLSSTPSPTPQIVINLSLVTLQPLIGTLQANNFGITELLGSGVSFFRGSITGRIHNIALAAARINGVLIAPGETFSFNQTVGDISAATGYKQAYVIKEGRTVLDDGGGVCQVSTTLFRAALDAGLPVVERHAHSYRVGYYEQGGWKPGFDATVYAPSYDLKIRNDTPTHILIQATTDTANARLSFDLYGRSDGRTVSISPVRLWESKPAPPDLYQDDPTLRNGEIKQVDWAASGIKAAFDYTVTRRAEEPDKTTFISNFIPWQAVYLRGTGPAQ